MVNPTGGNCTIVVVVKEIGITTRVGATRNSPIAATRVTKATRPICRWRVMSDPREGDAMPADSEEDAEKAESGGRQNQQNDSERAGEAEIELLGDLVGDELCDHRVA